MKRESSVKAVGVGSEAFGEVTGKMAANGFGKS